MSFYEMNGRARKENRTEWKKRRLNPVTVTCAGGQTLRKTIFKREASSFDGDVTASCTILF
jgi:hypothetical protein